MEEIISESRSAQTDLARAVAGHRLNAAIAIHDSVLGGVLCPLLKAVPNGEPLAARLGEGCRQRATLQQAWNALTKGASADELYRLHASEADAIIKPLIESFRSHEKEETVEVTTLLRICRICPTEPRPHLVRMSCGLGAARGQACSPSTWRSGLNPHPLGSTP